MKKFILLFFTISVLPHSLFAQSLIGTWDAATESYPYSGINTLVFNEDGTFARDMEQTAVDFNGNIVKGTYHEEGTWKILNKRGRLKMKKKPSSVKLNSGEGISAGIGKVVETFMKINAFSTLYFPRIISLTEDELVLLETVEVDEDFTRTEEITYLRRY